MAHKARRETRTKVLIRATWRAGGPEHEACVLDASPHGMLVTCAAPPPRGAFVELLVADGSFVGHVEWAGERRFGLTLYDPIDVAVLTGAPARPSATARRRARLKPQAPSPAEQADRARFWARRIDFALMAGAGLAASLAVAYFVAQQLAPLQVVVRVMAEANVR